jgi:hypothetical protein
MQKIYIPVTNSSSATVRVSIFRCYPQLFDVCSYNSILSYWSRYIREHLALLPLQSSRDIQKLMNTPELESSLCCAAIYVTCEFCALNSKLDTECCNPKNKLLSRKGRFCGLVVLFYRTEMYLFSCEVRTVYICYVEERRPPLWSSRQSSWIQNGDVLFPVTYELNLCMLFRWKLTAAVV